MAQARSFRATDHLEFPIEAAPTDAAPSVEAPPSIAA